MIRQAIAKAAGGGDLGETEMQEVMDYILSGLATDAQVGALLVALRMKGETVAEISGAARIMRQKAHRVPTAARRQNQVLVDVVGTGGDGAGTFNVSTTAGLVVAGAGVPVAKHGNRAVSSSCGSADLAEALGISLELSPEQVGACIDQVGIGFLFAPALHGAMRHAVGPRREIGLRSIFNLLGPLTNPAEANALVVGVYDAKLIAPLAGVLARLGVDQAMVVHGRGGFDEVSITGPTDICRLQDGRISTMSIAPEDCGLARAKAQDIAGGQVEQCRRYTLDVLGGSPGPRRDMVLMNAAAGLVVAGAAADMAQGVALAAEAIDSGAARRKLDELRAMSQDLQPQGAAA